GRGGARLRLCGRDEPRLADGGARGAGRDLRRPRGRRLDPRRDRARGEARAEARRLLGRGRGRHPGGLRGARVIVIDAAGLGRGRTGAEPYVATRLRERPDAAPGPRFAAVTRRPDLVPAGVEPLHLAARLQEWRMAVGFPRLLRHVKPELAHFQYALPTG